MGTATRPLTKPKSHLSPSQPSQQKINDNYNLDRQITKDNFKNLPLGL